MFTTLLRAAAAGAATGVRSQSGLAAAALTTTERTPGRPARLLARPWVTRAVTAAAVAEIAVDKTPMVPSRLHPLGLVPRLGYGALCGCLLASRAGTSAVLPAAVGSASALAGSLGGTAWRSRTNRAGWPPLLAAAAEDAVAVGLAAVAFRSC